MKFSLQWLNDFVDINDFLEDPELLKTALTDTGLEVEGTEDLRLQNVIAAEIQSVEKHPNADRLTLCRVWTGEETLPVVCGAKNQKKGDKAVLALPGAVLPGYPEKVKKTKIRGEVSCGFLASRKELGLEGGHAEEGICILPPPSAPGTPFAKIAGFRAFDILMDVNVTPNRADCLSHFGLAREISSLLNRPLRAGPSDLREEIRALTDRLKRAYLFEEPGPPLPLIKQSAKQQQQDGGQKNSDCKISPLAVSENKTKPSAKGESAAPLFPTEKPDGVFSEKTDEKNPFLQVKDTTACPRYCGRLIEGVTPAPSPLWLKDRLEKSGIKSINNIVDVTNYILLDQGQPLHAFDRDKITSLSIAPSRKGEKFITLNKRELTLTGEELTIRDRNGATALAGVIGGMSSAVTDETKNIFVESACFRPESVRRTARRFGLETDSSYRFSRGTDPEGTLSALNRACFMIRELAGGRIHPIAFDEYPNPLKRKKIRIPLSDVSRRLGLKITPEEFKDYMTRLKCELSRPSSGAGDKAAETNSQTTENETSAVFEVTPPSFRRDLSLPEDLMEETARLKGYGQIPMAPVRPMKRGAEPDKIFSRRTSLSTALKNQGWREAIHYSFSDPALYEDFIKDREKFAAAGLPFRETFSVSNPISSRLSFMKPLLLPDIFQTACGNVRKNNRHGRVFETSSVFQKEEKDYMETPHLGLACWGEPLNFRSPGKTPNIFHIKSVLEFLLKRFRWRGWEWKSLSDPPGFFHPGQALSLWLGGRPLGLAGTAHPAYKLKHKATGDMAFGEFDLKALWERPRVPLGFKPFPELSVVERDLCFVIPENISAGEVLSAIQKTLGRICNEVTVFDVYGKGEERSLSFRMFLAPEKRALTDEELNALQNKVIEQITLLFPAVRLKR